MLDFYYHPSSPPSRAVQIFLKLTHIEHTAHAVNLMGGEQKTAEFLAMNSVGQVPVIKDGDYVLAEGQAILAYLHASRQCRDDLYPADAKKRGLVDRHLHWYHTNIRLGGLLFRKTIIDPMRGVVVTPESLEETKATLKQSLQQMEGWLGIQAYMAGETLTIADLATHAYCVQVRAIGYDFAPYPRVTAWMDTINAMPEVREVNQVFLGEIVAQMRQKLHQQE